MGESAVSRGLSLRPWAWAASVDARTRAGARHARPVTSGACHACGVPGMVSGRACCSALQQHTVMHVSGLGGKNT